MPKLALSAPTNFGFAATETERKLMCAVLLSVLAEELKEHSVARRIESSGICTLQRQNHVYCDTTVTSVS